MRNNKPCDSLVLDENEAQSCIRRSSKRMNAIILRVRLISVNRERSNSVRFKAMTFDLVDKLLANLNFEAIKN